MLIYKAEHCFYVRQLVALRPDRTDKDFECLFLQYSFTLRYLCSYVGFAVEDQKGSSTLVATLCYMDSVTRKPNGYLSEDRVYLLNFRDTLVIA